MLELNLGGFSFGTLMILNGLFSRITESVSVVEVCFLFNLCTVVRVDVTADCTNSLILSASCWWPGAFSYSGNANLNINSLSSLTPNRVRAFVDSMWKSRSLSNSCDKDWSIHLVNTRAIGILLWITVNKISDAYKESGDIKEKMKINNCKELDRSTKVRSKIKMFSSKFFQWRSIKL